MSQRYDPFAGRDPFEDGEGGGGKEEEKDPTAASRPPDVIRVEGEASLVRVEEGEEDDLDESARAKAEKRANRRKIRIMESPGSLASAGGGKDWALRASNPTKYYKPPKSRSPNPKPSTSASSPGSYSAYAGSSSPATFHGLLRGLQRLFGSGEEDLSFHKDRYSATGVSPDARTAEEASKKADRRAGRTMDLYSDENKQDWRIQCQMRAQERDVDYVKDMKVVYRSEANDNAGDPILVGIGAHYSKRMIPREDMLLHILKAMVFDKETAGKPISILYFHSNAQLEKKPKVGFFKSLHVALGGESFCRSRIKNIYVVHPTPLLRTWILAFQLRIDPVLFKRVTYVNSLRDLQSLLVSQNLLSGLPQHILDHDDAK